MFSDIEKIPLFDMDMFYTSFDNKNKKTMDHKIVYDSINCMDLQNEESFNYVKDIPMMNLPSPLCPDNLDTFGSENPLNHPTSFSDTLFDVKNSNIFQSQINGDYYSPSNINDPDVNLKLIFLHQLFKEEETMDQRINFLLTTIKNYNKAKKAEDVSNLDYQLNLRFKALQKSLNDISFEYSSPHLLHTDNSASTLPVYNTSINDLDLSQKIKEMQIRIKLKFEHIFSIIQLIKFQFSLNDTELIDIALMENMLFTPNKRKENSQSEPFKRKGLQREEKSIRGPDIPSNKKSVLVEWFNSHHSYPYPNAIERSQLEEKTGLSKKQIMNWFCNTRKRYWKNHLAVSVGDNRSSRRKSYFQSKKY